MHTMQTKRATFLEPTRGGRHAPRRAARWRSQMNGGSVEVAQLWGDSLVGLAHFRAGESVVLGESAGAAFFVPGEEHVLVTHRAGEPIVRIPRGAEGRVEKNGAALPLAAWLARGSNDDLMPVAEIPLAPGERVIYEAAPGLTLLVQRVDRSAPVSGKSFDGDDARFLAIFASLAFGFASIGAMIKLLAILGAFATPVKSGPDLARLSDLPMIFDMKDIVPAPTRTPAPLPRVKKADPDAGDPEAGSAAPLRGKAGTVGDRDGKAKIAKGGFQKSPSPEKSVTDLGVLGALKETGVPLVAIIGKGKLAGGAADNIGVFTGPDDVAMRGSRGFVLHGDEKGGGGDSIFIPGFDRPGRTYGGVDGDGNKPGKKGKKKGDAIIGIDDGEAVVTVGLDPALIAAVIDRHLAQLQTCYESRLNAVPTLSGKVVMKFTIDGSGFVSSAAADGASTLSDDAVHACMVKRFKSMRFPAPPGKGTVAVKYPFLFKTAGH